MIIGYIPKLVPETSWTLEDTYSILNEITVEGAPLDTVYVGNDTIYLY